MSQISYLDLDVVNRATWHVMSEMSEVLRKYGTPEMDLSSYMSRTPDSSGLIWMGEVREMVHMHLMSVLDEKSEAHRRWQMSGSTYWSCWYNLYRKVVTWTIYGVVCRMSKSPEVYEMALRYEMAVLSDFDRWGDTSQLSEMWEMSVMDAPPALPYLD